MDVNGFGSLLRQAQGGDPRAVERLFSELRPYIAKVAEGYTDSARASASASDLIQEAELRAWRHLDQFRGGAGDEEIHAKFRTWLVQIVRRIAMDRSRARSRRKRAPMGGPLLSLEAGRPASDCESGGCSPDPSSPGPSPSDILGESERSLLIRSALESVRDGTDREVIRLHFFEQLALPAIAARLGLTYDQAREGYRRGLQQLEHHLQSLRPGPED